MFGLRLDHGSGAQPSALVGEGIPGPLLQPGVPGSRTKDRVGVADVVLVAVGHGAAQRLIPLPAGVLVVWSRPETLEPSWRSSACCRGEVVDPRADALRPLGEPLGQRAITTRLRRWGYPEWQAGRPNHRA